eukprot:CCRYP_016910-RA/>CCRYP_016910-RA protein AED:1.00 eAED:1.00 QI:0/-1/0/1/-1/1/1/0/517
MASSIYKAPDVASLVDIIETEGIDNLEGRPDCHKLVKLVNQLANGCRNIDCDYSNYGMSWLVFPQALYASLTGKNIVAPIQPPLVPPYNANGTQQENAVISIQWQKNKELYEQMVNTDKALIAITKSKLDPKFRAQLSNMFVGTPNRTFQAFYLRLNTKFGRPSPHDITRNDERMRSASDATDDISFLIKQIRDGTVFAYFVGQQNTDKELVTLGEKAILNTGLFATQYQGWKRRPDQDRTWTDFEEYWQAEYDLWHETSNIAAQIGYGGNVTTDNDSQETELAYFTSLQHFVETNSHNAATFSTLSATNAQMANSIQTQIADLTCKMEGLANAVHVAQPAQPAPTYAPYQQATTGQPHNPGPQPTYQPIQGQVYMHGQAYVPQPPPQRPYGNRGYGRHGGSRCRGGQHCGRHNAQYRTIPTHPTPWPAPPYPPHHTQPTQQGFYHKPTHTNPVKYHKNWNYCWSCGYDVADDHHSGTCLYPKQGHVYHATRENPCNGCRKTNTKRRCDGEGRKLGT